METFWTLARVVVSLAVVLGLVWALGRAARRRGLGGGPQAEVTVVGRAALSRSASVAVVRVGSRAMVLGVTDSSVSLLGAVDPEDLTVASPAPVQEPAQPASAPEPARVEPAFEHVMATLEAHPERSARPEQALTRAELRSRAAPGSHAAPTGAPAPTPAPSVLAGSALSPATWSRAVGVLRERSARR